MMVSPGTAGLSGVMLAPAMFAQQVLAVSAVIVTTAFVLDEPERGIPLPSGPGTLARTKMREKAADPEATAGTSGSALIKATSASRTEVSVSVATTVYE